MTGLRVVVDANVLVSAIIRPQGRVGPVLLHLRQERYTLLYNQATLEELVNVLNRPRIGRKYGITSDDIETILRLLLLRGEAVDVEERIAGSRDPKDDKFLEVAVAAQADLIVSGDDDLLVLHPFREIPIVRPRAFLTLLEEQEE